MTAINLSSLTTFWSSVKTFVSGMFADKTELWSGSSNSGAVLSESIDHFDRIDIFFGTNDSNIAFNCTTIVPSSSTSFNLFGSAVNSSRNFYGKVALFDIASDRKTISFNNCWEIGLKANNSISREAKNPGYIYLKRIVGRKRVSSNS